MTALELINVRALMEVSEGRPDILVALIDGPAAIGLPNFTGAHILEVPSRLAGNCSRADSGACSHGTAVAAVLVARRGSIAPAICPGCTLLLRPIFAESGQDDGAEPRAAPEELSDAIVDAVNAGGRILNLSVSLQGPALKNELRMVQALDYAAQRGAIAIAAAGNQGSVSGTVIIRHPAVLPVAACNLRGEPLSHSNLGSSIGRRGLMAPGEGVTSLGVDGGPHDFSGTSAAAALVTGAAALLWSEFPELSAVEIKQSLVQARSIRRRSVVPPLLDAWAAYAALSRSRGIRGVLG